MGGMNIRDNQLIDDEYVAVANHKAYARPAIIQYYLAHNGQMPPEPAVFAACEASWRGGDVLDIGIGAGRTCEFLPQATRSYVGLDYVPGMVAAARARFPHLDLRQGDSRDLSDFADASFDFVLFSFNGIDSIDHDGRMRSHREAWRVLRPGGAYMFSGHNLDNVGSRLFLKSMFRAQVSASPIATLKAFARIGVRIANYLRNRRRALPGETHALMPDPGNDFAAPHYYAGAAEVRRQLEVTHFEAIQVFDWTGAIIDGPVERASFALYYIARKPVS